MPFYKNMCGHHIHVNLFGIGDVNVPATAACVELQKHVADAINGMVYPSVVLKEVEPALTKSPVVDAKKATKAGKKTAAALLEDALEDDAEEDGAEEDINVNLSLLDTGEDPEV